MAEDLNRERNPETLFEPHDASVREVVLTGVGVAAGVIIVCVVIWGLFNLLKTEGARMQTFSPTEAPRELPPQPRLQVNAPAELQQMQQQEEEMLKSYGWVNKNAGTVRIPIGQAMEILAKRGLPARTAEQIAAAQGGGGLAAGPETTPRGAAVAGAQPQVANPATPGATQEGGNEKK
jgi:hypothetical protein